MKALVWRLKTFADLNTEELYHVLKLRVDVFVVEQKCAYPELDGNDTKADVLHLLGLDNEGVLTAYARLIAPGQCNVQVQIGRFVVAQHARGKGVGRAMLEQAISTITKRWPGCAMRLSAQTRCAGLYAAKGFTAVGHTYLDYGIEHIDMIKED